MINLLPAILVRVFFDLLCVCVCAGTYRSFRAITVSRVIISGWVYIILYVSFLFLKVWLSLLF